MIDFAFPIIVIAMLIGFGSIGWFTEHAHLRRLVAEEAALAHITVTNLKQAAANMTVVPDPFVIGEVVIGSDYLKTAIASLRGIIGGEIRSYRTLMDRGRREALVRMLRQADAQGATAVINVRIERAELGSAQLPAAEIIATGTAVR